MAFAIINDIFQTKWSIDFSKENRQINRLWKWSLAAARVAGTFHNWRRLLQKTCFPLRLLHGVPLRGLHGGYLSNSRCRWTLCFTRCRSGSLLRYLFCRLHRKALDYRRVIPDPIQPPSVCQSLIPARHLAPAPMWTSCLVVCVLLACGATVNPPHTHQPHLKITRQARALAAAREMGPGTPSYADCCQTLTNKYCLSCARLF